MKVTYEISAKEIAALVNLVADIFEGLNANEDSTAENFIREQVSDAVTRMVANKELATE